MEQMPSVNVGILRYWRRSAYANRAALRDTVIPIGSGSVIGACAGGLLLGIVAVATLKLGLGVILIVSAVRVFRHSRA